MAEMSREGLARQSEGTGAKFDCQHINMSPRKQPASISLPRSAIGWSTPWES